MPIKKTFEFFEFDQSEPLYYKELIKKKNTSNYSNYYCLKQSIFQSVLKRKIWTSIDFINFSPEWTTNKIAFCQTLQEFLIIIQKYRIIDQHREFGSRTKKSQKKFVFLISRFLSRSNIIFNFYFDFKIFRFKFFCISSLNVFFNFIYWKH